MKPAILAFGLLGTAALVGCNNDKVETSAAPSTKPAATTFQDLSQPQANAAMPLSYAKVIAAQAYVWAWPMVN